MRILPAMLLAATVIPAQAAIVKHEFTGYVWTLLAAPAGGEIEFVTSSSVAGPTISLQDTWTGAIFYDSEMAPAQFQPEQPPAGSSTYYRGYIATQIADAETGLLFNSDMTPWAPPFMMVNDMPQGMFGESVVIHAHAAGANFESTAFVVSNSDGTALASSAPPLSMNMPQFTSGYITYTFEGANGEFLSAQAVITSLTPVPEPATYAMLGLGLAALAMTKRFRRA